MPIKRDLIITYYILIRFTEYKPMILIFEPQCIGFEHAEFNAALIKVLEKSSNDELLFIGEKEHINNIKKLLKPDERINFKEIEVPPKDKSDMGRFRQEFGLTKEVFYLADSLGCDQIICSSIKSPSLIAVKYYVRRFKNIKVLIVPHSIIDSMNEIPFSRDIIFWFNFWFRFFNSAKIKYILLGKTIQEELIKEIPKMERYLEYMDHPWLFKNFDINENPLGDKIVFGFLGVGYRKKGIEDFINLSKKYYATNNGKIIKFNLVGHLPQDNGDLNINSTIDAPKTPLSNDEYNQKLMEIDYALFLHKASDYRFTASGAFFEAISSLKPIIAIKNPFMEYYFNLMGDIGYLCDDFIQLENIISDIIKNPPEKRYKAQQLNILQGREKISIEKIAEKFRKIK